jgi:hypothetical protein
MTDKERTAKAVELCAYLRAEANCSADTEQKHKTYFWDCDADVTHALKEYPALVGRVLELKIENQELYEVVKGFYERNPEEFAAHACPFFEAMKKDETP